VNLGHHVDVLFRQKAVVAVGLCLGILLAILAVFHVPSMERRGAQKWSVESQFLVTQSGFPEGRVTLPNTQATDPTAPAPSNDAQRSTQTFADPSRLSSLAVLYAAFAISDQVRRKLPGPPARDQIQAITVDASGNGSNYLPIIRLITSAPSAGAAEKLNAATFQALKSLLASRQQENGIAPLARVKLSQLSAPSQPLMVNGPSYTPGVLAFILALIATFAAVHIREGLTARRGRVEGGDELAVPIEDGLAILRHDELAPIRAGSRRMR
jgi:hypothetical protein